MELVISESKEDRIDARVEDKAYGREPPTNAAVGHCADIEVKTARAHGDHDDIRHDEEDEIRQNHQPDSFGKLAFALNSGISGRTLDKDIDMDIQPDDNEINGCHDEHRQLTDV